MFYLVCTRSSFEKDLFEYIIVHDDEVFINDNSTDRRIIVKYDDIHSFLQTHKKELLGASIIIDELFLNGEFLNFIISKLKEYVIECKMYVEFHIDLLQIQRRSQIFHIYDFIEKMENREFKPKYFHIQAVNECYTVGHEPYH